jgi:hypothetical protein
MTLDFVLYMQAILTICIPAHCNHSLRSRRYGPSGVHSYGHTDFPKKRSMEFVFPFFLNFVSRLEATFSITERQNISESKSAPPLFTDLLPRLPMSIGLNTSIACP